MNEAQKIEVAGFSSPASFTKRVLIIAAVVALGFAFAARIGLAHRWALAAVVVALLALAALAAWFFGERIGQQFDQILARVPEAWGRLRTWLEQQQFGRYVLESLSGTFVGADKAGSALARLATGTFGAIADAVIILVVGLYLAAEPTLYRRGLIKLTPPSARARVNETLDAIVTALKRWLLGQAVAMLAIGVMTGIGLWALGIPMALGLAIMAGLLEFVPYIGPFLAAVPAVLIAFAQNPLDALYVLLLYWGVQQFENWTLIPLIEKWSVELPPVLAILSLVIFGLLFGIPGVIVAAPLMIVMMIMIRKLYIEGMLGDKA
jgi:predicted PurR-regulated permease PerM